MIDFSATLEIAYIAWCYTSITSSLPFVVMWIMDMGFDASGAPAKSGMTLSTPHLVAISNNCEIIQNESFIFVYRPAIVISLTNMNNLYACS